MKVNIRELAPFAVRVQPDLKDWFKDHAKETDRSMSYIFTKALEMYKQHIEEERKIAGM